MVRRSRLAPITTALFAAALLAGCAAPSTSGHTYTSGEARRPMQVQMGVIQAIREVRLEREHQTGAGTAAGAVVGGVAGSNVGRGRGAIVGSVLGAVAGGVVGSHAEQSLSNRTALELTVRTDAGRIFAVVQEADGETFSPGQRVRILTDPVRGTTRISQ
ncbi:MAG: glycine zipper 2TM domain-containing protein [Burkholderiaceae bacterium]|nr:glycine zipper 2TM domain-containing protein [Burkholderiaceae bacterium]MEB2351637.1 glycine zipper domain-containing protein [Burkholderiaceae bacterium]